MIIGNAAYVCGLGTFGLSKGIITRKGMAGRFASVIIDTVMSCDTRPFELLEMITGGVAATKTNY